MKNPPARPALSRAPDPILVRDGAEPEYRLLIESMHEGALTLNSDLRILYANGRFARMVKLPLRRVIGRSLQCLLLPADCAALRRLMRRGGGKLEAALQIAGTSPSLPARVSLRSLGAKGRQRATFGLVVTDITETRRAEDLLRGLAHRVIQAQEAERTSVARDLHDNLTQLLCGLLLRSQALADTLPRHSGPARREAGKLRVLLSAAAAEVERISRELRPSILDQLGLAALLEDTCTEFSRRFPVATRLEVAPLAALLSPATELAFYRIAQEALANVAQHARARHVTIGLHQFPGCVRLWITDDGVGFDTRHHTARRKARGVIGLVGMRERATSVGGVLTVKSGPQAGTEIEVRVPVTTPRPDERRGA